MFINTKSHFNFSDHMKTFDFPRSVLVKHTDSRRVHYHYFFEAKPGFDFKLFKLNLCKDLKEKYSKEFIGSRRPVSSKEGTIEGFQYVLKESAVLLHHQGFTIDQIEDLQKKNIQHVAQIKRRCHEWVVEKLTLNKIEQYTPEELWDNYTTAAIRYYQQEQKLWPMNHHKMCIYYCLQLVQPKVPAFFKNKLHPN